MRIPTLKLRWNQVEMLEKSLGSFFIIAAMLNISTVTVPHSIGSLSNRLILLFVSLHTTIFNKMELLPYSGLGTIGFIEEQFLIKGICMTTKTSLLF